MNAKLNDDEVQRLIDYARRKFAEERYPLAPALRPIRLLIERLTPSTTPMPPPKPPGEPSLACERSGGADPYETLFIATKLIYKASTAIIGENDMVCRRQCFETAARLGLLGQEAVEDGIGNAVTDLVRVAFQYRLASEHVVAIDDHV